MSFRPGQEVDVLVDHVGAPCSGAVAAGWRPATVVEDRGDAGVAVEFPNGERKTAPRNSVQAPPI